MHRPFLNPTTKPMNEKLLDELLALIRYEVLRACAKHPTMPTGHHGYAVIKEELDELWEHVRSDTWNGPKARKEAMQIAAMGIRYVLDLAPFRPPCAACDRGDFQLGHSYGCPNGKGEQP